MPVRSQLSEYHDLLLLTLKLKKLSTLQQSLQIYYVVQLVNYDPDEVTCSD